MAAKGIGRWRSSGVSKLCPQDPLKDSLTQQHHHRLCVLHVAGRTRGAHAINGTPTPRLMQAAGQGAPGANGCSNHSRLETEMGVWDLQCEPPRLIENYSEAPPLDVEWMFSSHG